MTVHVGSQIDFKILVGLTCPKVDIDKISCLRLITNNTKKY